MHQKDLDIADKNYAEARKRFVANSPIEDRLEGLTLEQALEGLTPEQVLAGLTLEQRLAGLTPEQIAAALSPEVLEVLEREAKR